MRPDHKESFYCTTKYEALTKYLPNLRYKFEMMPFSFFFLIGFTLTVCSRKDFLLKKEIKVSVCVRSTEDPV